MKFFSNLSLQGKLIAMNAGIVACIGAVLMFEVATITGELSHNVEHDFELFGKNTSEAVQAQFYERYGDVQAFAINPDVRSTSGARIISTLNNYAALYGIYDLILVADRSGKVVGVNDKDPAGKPIPGRKLLGRSVAQEEWFRNALAKKFTEDKASGLAGTFFEDLSYDPYVSEVYGEKRPGTSFSAPIVDESGEVIGVVSNRAGARWFEAELERTIYSMLSLGYHDPRVSVLNKDGILIAEGAAGSDGKVTVLRDSSVIASFKLAETGPAEMPTRIKSREAGEFFGKDPRREGELMWGYQPVSGKKWVDSIQWNILVSDSKADAFATVTAIRLKMLGIVSVFMCLAVAAAFIFSRKLAGMIRGLAARLDGASSEVNQVAQSLANASTDLSSSSSEQAAALQETVASIDEVSAMVQKNADNAKRSQEVSAGGSQTAQKGKAAVQEMIQSISEIESSNQEIVKQVEEGNRQVAEIAKVITEIGEKTKVINDIVFQTRLLSFNASVEAARAGEAGKGFAVVAEEVGNLAQMSGNAAKDISEMLEASVKKVEQIVTETRGRVERLTVLSREKVKAGSSTAHRCGEVLDEIVTSVNHVNSMVEEIAVASKEQATGVQEINKAMNQLDEVTQANATASQSVASGAVQLRGQSLELSKVIAQLVEALDGQGAPARVQAPQAPAVVKSAGRKDPEPKAGKVIPFVKKSAPAAKETAPAPALKAAAGGDILPSRDDSRFEEV